MKSLIKILLVAAAAVPVLPSNAQKKISEGKITFEISYPDSDMPDEMAAMMPTEMDMYIKTDKSRIDMTMGMGMNQVMIFDNKAKTMTMLMDMMGKKIKVVSTEADMKKKREKDKTPEYKIEKTDETKTIAGYLCKKAKVTSGDYSFDMFYTDDIVLKGAEWTSEYKGIDGFPMEYLQEQGEMKMLMKAKKVAVEKIDDSKFAIPDGYKEMTPEEMQRTFGGQ